MRADRVYKTERAGRFGGESGVLNSIAPITACGAEREPMSDLDCFRFCPIALKN
jgi:hypothetical protein